MNTNKYLELRANARKWKHLEGGIMKYLMGGSYLSFYASDQVGNPVEEQEIYLPEAPSNETQTTTTSTTTQPTDRWKRIMERLASSESTPSSTTITSQSSEGLSSDLTGLINLFNEEGLKIKVTSGYRKGATTKLGNKSHHSTGHAIDIVPENGDFIALANAIKSNPRISQYMKSKGLGIIDETTAEMLAKTGGTGAHFHIGPDQLGLKFWA